MPSTIVALSRIACDELPKHANKPNANMANNPVLKRIAHIAKAIKDFKPVLPQGTQRRIPALDMELVCVA